MRFCQAGLLQDSLEADKGGNRMKKEYVLCLSILLLIVLGCGSSVTKEKAGSQIVITDATGRNVTLKQPITTYAISTFDLVDFVIPLKGKDAFSMLVGVGDSGGKKYYDRQYEPMFPQYKKQWKVISPHNAPFDVEAILKAKPDVLIVNSAMQAHMHALDIEAKLKEAGIGLVLIDVPKVTEKSAQETYRLLGKIFGEEKKAENVAAFIDRQFADLEARLKKVSGPKPLVYYEKSGTAEIFGPSSNSGVSGWGSLIKASGGDNLADRPSVSKVAGGPPGSVSLDPEYILASDPDFIILSGGSQMGLGADPTADKESRFAIVNRPGWKNFKAVKNKNVYEYQHELSRTCFVFYPALSFGKLFYPKEFQDVDPEQRLADFYNQFMLIKSTDGVWKQRIE